MLSATNIGRSLTDRRIITMETMKKTVGNEDRGL